MPKRNATLDTSFWINASRASIIGFLSDYFDLFVCQAVIDEVLYSINVLGSPAEGALLFQRWLQAGRMTRMEPQEPVDWFDPGENQAATLAIEQGYLLLIDDRYAYHFAKSRGVTVFSTPAFVVWLYRDQRLDYVQACLALGRLQAEKKLRRAALVALYQMARARGDV